MQIPAHFLRGSHKFDITAGGSENFIYALASEIRYSTTHCTDFDPPQFYSKVASSEQFCRFIRNLYEHAETGESKFLNPNFNAIIRQWSLFSESKRKQRKHLMAALLNWRRNILLKCLLSWSNQIKIGHKRLLRTAFCALVLNRYTGVKFRAVQSAVIMALKSYTFFKLQHVIMTWNSIATPGRLCRARRLENSFRSFRDNFEASHLKNEFRRRSLCFWIGCIYTRYFHHWRAMCTMSQARREKGIKALLISIFHILLCSIVTKMLLGWRIFTKAKLVSTAKIYDHRQRSLCATFEMMRKHIETIRIVRIKITLLDKKIQKQNVRFFFHGWNAWSKAGLHLKHTRIILKRRVIQSFVKRARSSIIKCCNLERALSFFWARSQPRWHRKFFNALREGRRAALNIQKKILELQSKHDKIQIWCILKAWNSRCKLFYSMEVLKKWYAFAEHFNTAPLLQAFLTCWNKRTIAQKFDYVRERRAALYMFILASAESSAIRTRERISILANVRIVIKRVIRTWVGLVQSRPAVQMPFDLIREELRSSSLTRTGKLHRCREKVTYTSLGEPPIGPQENCVIQPLQLPLSIENPKMCILPIDGHGQLSIAINREVASEDCTQFEKAWQHFPAESSSAIENLPGADVSGEEMGARLPRKPLTSSTERLSLACRFDSPCELKPAIPHQHAAGNVKGDYNLEACNLWF